MIAAFQRSLYVETAAGLACIGPHALGGGPLNVLIDGMDALTPYDPPVALGTPARTVGGVVHISRSLRIDLSDTESWEPPAPPPLDRGLIDAGLTALALEAAGRAPPHGLAPLAFTAAPDDLGATASATLRRAQPAAEALRAWLAAARSDAAAPPPDEAAVLIGLGPGLTPAGDDLVGGALLALHAVGRPDVADRLAEWALGLAAKRTNPISRAHLAAAAEGSGAEAVHRTVNAVMAADRDAMPAALAAVEGIGHTSGWDALTGATLALGTWR